MGAATVALVNVTRGGKKPLSVAYTSNFAEAFGVFVPIPVCAFALTNVQLANNMNTTFFIELLNSIN